MIIKVLSFRTADLARYSKDKFRQQLNVIKWHLDAIRIKRLGAMRHHEHHHPPADCSASQLQRYRNMETISNQSDQGLTYQHACSTQSSTQQGVSLSQENLTSSLCNDSLVGNALCSFQSRPKSLKQQSPTNHAIQTNMVASPSVDCKFGLEQGSPSLLHHGLGKSLRKQNLNSQQNPLPSTIVNSLVPTMSSLLTSSVNSSHVVKEKATNQIMHKMLLPVQKSRTERKMQQMVVQKEFSLQQQKLSIQPAGYSPQSLTSSLPATDHEEQSFCAEQTVHLQRPLIPVEKSRTANRNYTPAGSFPETSASPLSVEFGTPENSLQPQPIKRLIKVVCGIYFAKLIALSFKLHMNCRSAVFHEISLELTNTYYIYCYRKLHHDKFFYTNYFIVTSYIYLVSGKINVFQGITFLLARLQCSH